MRPRGCELDSRSVERIVEHSSFPERSKMHQNHIYTENPRMTNGTYRPNACNQNGLRQVCN